MSSAEPVVLVTDHPAPSVKVERAILRRIGARLVIASSGTEEELIALVHDADAVLTCFRQVTPAVVRAGRRLRVIGRYGVGVDNIAVDVATELGIAVTHVPDYCVDEVAEHAIALLLTLARKTATYDRAVRAGDWRIESGMPMRRLSGSTLGIVGFGQIGQAVSRRGLALGMHVLVADRSATAAEVEWAGARLVTLESLLPESDAVSLHVPLTGETRGLIDSRRIAMMKPTAILINCARGAVVDLQTLALALRDGRLAGAGIDVFEPERLASDHPLLALGNAVLTPHVAFYSEESVAELQRRATENVVAVLSGFAPEHSVNRVAGARP